MKTSIACALLASALMAAPALAQDAGGTGVAPDGALPPEGPPETVFDGDYVSIGIGAGYGPSYSGSDDYTVFPLPIVQASIGGIDINPRPAGLAIDFIPDPDDGPAISFGVAGRLRSDRADIDQIKDPVVQAFGELDRAIEVGPTAGISFPGVLHQYDSLSFNVDALWDVAGAHGGMSVSPSVTYFTPLSRAMIASLSFSTSYVDDDFADYYYSVTPLNNVAPGGPNLPAFQADGGFESVGANLLLGYDLSGDATDGGFALIGIAGYSRLLGDAKNSPFTSDRGSADQWLVGLGIGYTFGL